MAELESPSASAVGEPEPAVIPVRATPVQVDPERHDQRGHGPGVKQRAGDAPELAPCPGCASTGGRNLVVCIDGTSNQFSTKNTNVVELYSRLIKDKNQLTFYNSGIGTYAKPSWKSWSYRKQVFANKLDLAFALRLEKIIISAYAWLVDNYEEGDRIFLFGFSRGAYQVRALAAMIETVGLLHKGNNDQIAFAYELYASSGDATHGISESGKTIPRLAWLPSCKRLQSMGESVKHALRRIHHKTQSSFGAGVMHSSRVLVSRILPHGQETEIPSFPRPILMSQLRPESAAVGMQEQFKSTFSRKVTVHFVGAWDTVSSVGLVRNKTLPSTTEGMKFVCFFRHALALHEYRVKFLPEYANGGDRPDRESPRPGISEPHTKEVWFTGSHSDIGGGSTTNTTLDKFGPALRWMSWEATLAGLRLDDSPHDWEATVASTSMTPIWRLIECLPVKHLSYQESRKERRSQNHWMRGGIPELGASSRRHQPTTRRPHLSANRCVKPGQRIHQSVYAECGEFKLPVSVEREPDAYIEAKDILRPREEVLRIGYVLDERNARRLDLLTSSAQGIQSLRELNLLQYIYDLALSCRSSGDSARITGDLRLLYGAHVKGLFRDATRVGLPQTVKSAELSSSTTFPFHMCGHTRTVSSVAFLSHSLVVSGSYDGTLRLWDANTGEMPLSSPLRGHNDWINCVAVHPGRGIVASASNDSTIRLWSSESNGAVYAEKVLEDGCGHRATSVAFSHDGSRVLSGWGDGFIRVWNTATGERVGEPVRGHTDAFSSITSSPDGTWVASGSYDRTVQLWEWSPDDATLQPSGAPLNGHTHWVWAVAFSPDARVIASASDKTIRLWDVANRTATLTLVGHAGGVPAVAFSPSGTLIVSGSDDRTVRVWDARTGTSIRVLPGHTDEVWSVAFSPDGTRLASGSRDKTVRVWDLEPAPDVSHHDEGVLATRAQIAST